jgi:hypothetical protein
MNDRPITVTTDRPVASTSATPAMIRSLLRQPASAVWLALVLITCVSWWLGTGHGTTDHKLAAIVLMVVAFTKVRFVGMYFMELRGAPIALRTIFQLWCVVVCCIVLGLYLGGG